MIKFVSILIRGSLDDFRRNKIRTLLTSLGILIGVASVVLLTAFGLGLKEYIRQQFENLGTNLIIVLPGQIFRNGSIQPGGGAFGGAKFDEKDIITLKKIPGILYAVPIYQKNARVEGPIKTETSQIFVTSADIFTVRNLEIGIGKAFEKSDVEKRSKVVVLGPKLADKIFGSSEDAIGKSVKIEKKGYKVIGVLKAKGGGGFGAPDFDSFTYVPYKSADSLNTDKKFLALYIKAGNDTDISVLKSDMNTQLLKRYKKDDFSVVEQTEILQTVSSIFAILNSVLIAIAGISLLVGGIGIMNIMYVSVVERIREIGIRRALGAMKKDILFQFLTEAVILSLIGGLFGLLVSFAVVLIIRYFFPAAISSESVLIALGVSSGIGVVFGVLPAKKASDLSPIEAIRYE